MLFIDEKLQCILVTFRKTMPFSSFQGWMTQPAFPGFGPGSPTHILSTLAYPPLTVTIYPALLPTLSLNLLAL